MPTGNLPPQAKRIFEAAEASAKTGTCKDAGDRKAECAARVGWSQVKKKFKKVGDKWIPKAELKEFSFAITKAAYQKETGKMCWRAVASDTYEDHFKDNMTLELFNSFLTRIENKESPPEDTRLASDFWSGGMPYLSISHYPDLSGEGIPGPVEKIYIDGNRLKAIGTFSDTELGRTCFRAVCDDLYGETPSDDKVRISIAFLDWQHRHKNNGELFERSEVGELCPFCITELIVGKSEGRAFLDGHLVQLALTRVPVNPRTDMEVERAMKTQLEDATSIIGEDLAEELFSKKSEDEEIEVGASKSEALIVKAKAKSESDEEDEDEGVDKDKESKHKAKPTEKSEAINMSEEILTELGEIKKMLSVPEPEPHLLDESLVQLKTAYDEAISDTKTTREEKLTALQEPITVVGNVIMNSFDTEDGGVKGVEANDLVVALTKAIEPMAQKLELLTQIVQANPQQIKSDIPVRRNLQLPETLMQQKGKTSSLKDAIRQSVGL